MASKARHDQTGAQGPSKGPEREPQDTQQGEPIGGETNTPLEAHAYSESAEADETHVRSRRRRRGNGAAREEAGPIPDHLVEDVSAVTTAAAVGVAAAVIEAELLPGIVIGAGAMLLGKMFPRLTVVARPAAKMIIRAGIAMTDKAREMTAEAGEQMQDMVAEVRAEREQAAEQRARTRAARRGPMAEATA